LNEKAPHGFKSPRLRLIVFCQPEARRFSGEPLGLRLRLPDHLEPGRFPDEIELATQFTSSYLRPTDVPLAFHRESPTSISVLRSHTEALEKMALYGRMLQYVFSDGLVISAHQILYHAYAKYVPRHFLPLNINVKSPLQGDFTYSLMNGVGSGGHRTSWQIQAEQVLISILLSASRAVHQREILRQMGEDEPDSIDLYFTVSDDVRIPRECLRLRSLELGKQGWGPWRLTTDLAAPHSGVHYGRARLELDPDELGDLMGLTESFIIDTSARKLVLHSFKEQVRRLETRIGSPTQIEKPHELEGKSHLPGLESGLSVHLAGHALIESTVVDVSELLQGEGQKLRIFPAQTKIAAENITPRLLITGDGSFRFMTLIQREHETLEAHGLPQASAYLLLNLQLGLGATTGLSASQIAHNRKGIKRERDLKILRHLGFAQMIFYDAANFAFGYPLSNGALAKDESDLFNSLFERLGSAVLKSEGWPVQTGSLETLCSSNVINLIKGFVRQIVGDVHSRDLSLYMPDGELKLEGVMRSVVAFFHAMVSDLASGTDGACFTRARTKYFDLFLNGRPTPEREDLAVRRAMSPEQSARAIYQPGINERYLLPETSTPPRGGYLLQLSSRGFELTIDGKPVEDFNANDFRPEFTLNEEIESVPLGTKKIDWFELHPKFFFKGVEISAEQATRLSKEGMIEFQGKIYRVNAKDLPSLKRLNQFWSNIQLHTGNFLRSRRRTTEETYYQLPRSQTLELLALRSSGVDVRGGARWESICRFYDSLGEPRPTLEIPPSFKAKLQPYQERGVQWLLDLHELSLGGILADDMGLGKTVTSLAFLEILRAQGRMGSSLILVPTSLTYNWLAETERFTPEIPVLIFGSRTPEAMLEFLRANEKGAAVICTYGLLQEHAEIFQQVQWHTVIFDEAQNLKNITTKRTTAARKIGAEFKFCLTGTPLENHYGEFYSLFDLTVPGSLGDLASFREKYVNPPRVLMDDIAYLKLKTKPLLLRRTKAQVLHELPPKVETTIKLPFDEDQKRIYRDIATSYNEQIRAQIAQNGEAKSQLQMLTALLRLRQVCSDPSAVPGVQYPGEPPKVLTLIEALEEVIAGGASALVFTQFLATFERIRTGLRAAKIPFFDISGSDSRLNREKKLKAFEDVEEGAVMLMTLKTGGVGLNLTKASYVFHIEPWWNPAVENQATDRAHRMGQAKTVQVYRYIIRDSVEEKIELLKDLKSRRFDALFSADESEQDLGLGSPSGATLTQQDFEYLLSE
jgi:superfamily II DNA or RNA helicase